jgi:hypothetical protein
MKNSVGFTASANTATLAKSICRFIRVFPKLLIALLGILLAGALPSPARGGQAESNWEPEIVRLSYIQGDVRLSRGGKKGADLNTAWEVAKANEPIQEGFSVATGAGRVMIEFENGTILYLADNSVLEFNELQDNFGVPITDLELVTGTATVNARPAPRELFVISTPSERLSFPTAGLVRVDSFLNGATATPENEAGSNVLAYGSDGASAMNGPLVLYVKGQRFAINLSADEMKDVAAQLSKIRDGRVHLSTGQSITYQDGARVSGVANDSGAPADWDAWVLARVTKREQEMTAALKASGLSAPVPGLIDMYESGTFYPCEPDGQCWKPNGVDGSDGVIDLGDDAVMPDGTTVASESGMDAGLVASLGPSIFPAANLLMMQFQQSPSGIQTPAGQSVTAQQQAPGTIPPGGPRKPTVTVYRVRLDECSDEVHRQEVATDPVTGKRIVLNDTIEYDPWMWGVCNSGGWIPYRNHYRFVAGRSHHHPVCYVHIGKKICWVPRHPHDRRGQAPLNLKNGAFAPGKKPGAPLQFVKWNPSDKVKVLTTMPREFRTDRGKVEHSPAQRPDIHARLVTRGPADVARTQSGTKGAPLSGTKPSERTISYNYHSKTFERPGGAPVSGHTSGKPEVVGHFTANGQFNSGSHGSSRGTGGGSTSGGRTSGGGNGGYSGGGHSSGGSSGGGYSGGGHSGGGSSGGGGGHSGGGGTSGGGGATGGGGGHGH